MLTSCFARNLILGAFCAAATSLTASATPVNVTLLDPGASAYVASSVTIAGVSKSNVYIGPYNLSVDGVAMSAMCIDFDIESTFGDSYTAYKTTVGSSDLSHTYGESNQVYEEDAYLFSKIVQTGISDATRTAIQEAAWELTAYNITSGLYKLVLSDNTYIDDAIKYRSQYANGAYAIISDTSKYGEQEFIVDPPPASVTPEPSSFLLMLAPALAGAEAMRRRKLSQSFLG